MKNKNTQNKYAFLFLIATTLISFSSQSSQYLIQNEKQITFVGNKSGEGYFGPDGESFVFQSERHEGNPFYQIYLTNLKTGQLNLISSGSGKTTCAWIHPSLSKIMYSSTHLDPDFNQKVKTEIENRKSKIQAKYNWSYDETYEIYDYNLSTKKTNRLTNAIGYDAEGSYSPDGKWIAFASNRKAYDASYLQSISEDEKKLIQQDPSYFMDIYIMDQNGKNLKQLTDVKGYDGGPFFSADGKKITWRRFSPNGATAEIMTMNLDGSDQKQVTQLKVMSWAPYFHPSGKYIIFTTNLHGYSNFELYIVDAEGLRKPVRVTHNEVFDGLPTFNPKGDQLSWTKRNAKGESQIYIADWDHEKALDLLGFSRPSPQKLSFQIQKSDIQEWVQYLTQTYFKGRPTGSAEEQIYTAELAQFFKKIGLKPVLKDYQQSFEFTSDIKIEEDNTLVVEDSQKKSFPIKLGEEFNPIYAPMLADFSAPIQFVDYGLQTPQTDQFKAYDSYAGKDVKNKWVVMYKDFPEEESKEYRYHLSLFSRPQHKISLAKKMGAYGVVFISKKVKLESDRSIKIDGSLQEYSIPVIEITESTYNKYKNITKLTAHLNLVKNKSKGVNVIAQLGQPKAKNQIIIGAHLDHLGVGRHGSSLAKDEEAELPHYGADDNASGVALVLELAHYYSNLFKNKQLPQDTNITFALWSGEEMGILGSKAYLKEVTTPYQYYLNADMVGRLQNKLIIQGAASSLDWPKVFESTLIHFPYAVELTMDPYLPTDSLAFYLKDTPTISLFTGSHEDYHTPRDTADKINYEGIKQITDLASSIVLKISQIQKTVPKTTNFLAYNKVESSGKDIGASRSFRVYLGTIPDYGSEIKGVKISGVTNNSPAQKAGLKGEDIIIELDQTKIENLYDYTYALQFLKPDQTVKIKYLRKGEVVDSTITPALKE